MNTQLLLNYKPVRAGVLPPIDGVIGGLGDPIISANDYDYRSFDNPNYPNNKAFLTEVRRPFDGALNIDLYEDVDIPLNYSILDIREPEKRKTNFSKTIRIPGTKNNSRVFNHIYEISADSRFNPNLRTEVIILQGGVQVIRGNMQLKEIRRFNANEVEYDVIISGDITSLFADIGISKLNDLEFTEWRHVWNRGNIESSWNGLIKKDGADYINYDFGPDVYFNLIERQASTGRVLLTGLTPHGLVEGDWIRVFPNDDALLSPLIRGEWAVAEIISTTKITINWPFPDGLLSNSLGGFFKKWNAKGEGYVYPMVSWGDDSSGADGARFPTTAFVMGFYVKELWDKIFKQTNSRYVSDFINSTFFKRLILVQKKQSYSLPPGEFKGRSFKVANVSEPEVEIAGFLGGTQSLGSYNGEWRSIPTNTTYGQPYPFTQSVATTDGLLYNGDGADKPFNQSTNKWVVTDTGKYSLNLKLSVDSEMEISDFLIDGTYKPPVDDSPRTRYFFGDFRVVGENKNLIVKLELKRKTGGVTTTISQQQVDLWFPVNELIKDDYKMWRSPVKSLEVNFANVDGGAQFLKRDDELWVELSYYGQFDNNGSGMFVEYYDNQVDTPGANPRFTINRYRGKANVRVRGVQILQNEPSREIIENTEIFPQQFLPNDMTCRDFLLSIIKAFNLNIESDREIEGLYRIEPRDDYYKDGSGGATDFVDWTDKTDTRTIQIIPMGELTAKYYNFEYKSESDYWNKRYLDDVGIGWGNYLKEVQNDFLQNEVKISLGFGASPMINTPQGSNIVIPQIVQRDNGINKITNSAAKFLIWGGIRPTSKGSGGITNWNFVEATEELGQGVFKYNYYPYAGTVDSAYDPLVDLNFFYTNYVWWDRARWTNENLYNRYWKNFITEITDKDSKVVRAYLNLKPNDIYDLDFKKIFVINGDWLRLQKIIDYNATGDGLTQCEFLKVKAPTKFKRISQSVNDEYVRITDNTRPISTTVIDVAPGNYVDRTSLSNVIPELRSGNTTVVVSGDSNVVSGGSRNVNITGNECFVGPNSTNVNITGSGVFVGGGLNNVNIIGTDKIVVSESDVTYINGIRYKLGIPISRANVIDAGLNEVLKKSSPNININLIDAGEDVVINAGSQTPESVIDGGSDRILPDVPNWGLSTWTSINQSTNYAGSVVQDFSVKSLSQKIIDRVDPQPYQN